MNEVRKWSLVLLDVAAAAVLLLAYLPGPVMQTATPLSGGGEAYSPAAWLDDAAWLLAALSAVPILVRRLWPVIVLGLVLAASAAGNVLFHHRWPYPAVALVLLTIAFTTPRNRSAIWLVVCLTVAVGARILAAGHDFGLLPPTTTATDTAIQICADSLVLVAAWAIGLALRAQRHYLARTAEQAARQALVEHRLEIARELHDVMTHSLGLIAVKAAVANHVAHARPQEVPSALKTIEETSRAALADLRRVLTVLRAAPPEDAGARGEADLLHLVREVNTAGVQAELSITGNAEIPEAMEQAVYRIVQEALTNVVKHAAAARCRITVAVTETEVSVEVVDDGGHGLTGMRERVARYGGSFAAGPRPDGGWGINATLPLPA